MIRQFRLLRVARAVSAASSGTNSAQVATHSYVGRMMSTLPGSAPKSNLDAAPNVDDVVHAAPSGADAAVSSLDTLSSMQTAVDVAAATASTPEKPNFVVSGVMDFVDNVHLMLGIPYWEAIILSTIGLRFVLFPIALKSIQSSGRMAAMRPAMQKVQDAFSNDPNKADIRAKAKYEQEMRALFVKYKVNPFRAMLFPFVQLPIFISVFMALRQMGDFFPGYSTGGTLWFTDLAAADPTYILPIFNSLSFLIMIEIGSDGVQMQQKGNFKWIMRGLAVAMVPLTMSMPQGLFVYWAANNSLSIIQTRVLKHEPLRKYFDIPDPPAEAPDLKINNPFQSLMKAINEEKSRGEHAKAEILQGNSTVQKPSGPPPITFSKPPRRKKD